MERGSLYCRPEKRKKGLLGRTSPKYCSCGLKIRTTKEAHEEGMHHNKRVPKNSRHR